MTDKIPAYIFIFTLFNFFISLLYYLYGFITYKKIYNKISRSDITKEQWKFLSEIKFINVQRNWIKRFYLTIRSFSFIYFIISEILCIAAVYLMCDCVDDYVLVCRIAIFAAALLFAIWIFLLFYVNKKNKKLARIHHVNLNLALADFDRLQNEEYGVDIEY